MRFGSSSNLGMTEQAYKTHRSESRTQLRSCALFSSVANVRDSVVGWRPNRPPHPALGRRLEPNAAIMPPKDPTKHQLSARLQFQSHTPAFLRAFQNRVSGRRDEDEDAPQIEGDYGDYGGGEDAVDEFGRSVSRPARLDEFGREIRRAGSAEREKEAKMDQIRRREMEGEEDEKPVVVVLKEGKHLTEFEAENEKRKGLFLIFCPLVSFLLVFGCPQQKVLILCLHRTIHHQPTRQTRAKLIQCLRLPNQNPPHYPFLRSPNRVHKSERRRHRNERREYLEMTRMTIKG
jgi:hypothetical protein